MKASRRAWTAAKLLALTSAIAVSCALPGYEIEETGGTGASQAGSEGVTATGAGGAGGDDSTTSASGAGGTGGQNTNTECPPLAQTPPSSTCSVPSGIKCKFQRDCCVVEGACVNGSWEIPESCPPGCPTFPFGSKKCSCQQNELHQVCMNKNLCQPDGTGSVEVVKCDGVKWEQLPLEACCTKDGTCEDDAKVCVQFVANGAEVGLCRPNECSGVDVKCDCVDNSQMCFGTKLFKCKEATANGITCVNPSPMP